MPYRSFSSSLCYLMRFSIPILTGSLEKRLRVLDPETWVGSGAALILSTHKSTRRDWKAFLKYQPQQNSLRNRRGYCKGTVSIQTQTQLTRIVKEYPRTLSRKG